MLDIDEQEVRLFLANYGVSLEDVLEQAKKKKPHPKPKEEQDWIYLIHHMHTPEKGEGMEELHHCHFWDNKKMKGIWYEQRHVREGKIFHHVVDLKASKLKSIEDVPDTLYCHLNNAYKIRVNEIEGKEYAEFTGMVSLKKTKWSDQDK